MNDLKFTNAKQYMDTNWQVLTYEQIDAIMMRLDKLYQDMPLESAGVVLSAINDIEDILLKRDN